jgi:hypothetical protein
MVVIGALVVTGCGGGGPSQDEFDAQVAELGDVTGQLEDVRDQLEATQSSLDEALAARDAAEADRDAAVAAAEQQRDEAVAAAQAELDSAVAAAQKERDTAVAQAEALRLQYDPQIQAQVAGVAQAALDLACAAGDEAAAGGRPRPTVGSVVDRAVGDLPGDLVAAAEGAVDTAAVDAQLTACYDAKTQALAAEAAQAALVAPHGDGFWTVGLEIAPGLWRSDGSGDSCYWQISPDGNPDDIIDNHFGDAGGSVTLRAGQEFETDDCGTWTLG